MGGELPIVYSEILKYADEAGMWQAERRDRLVYHVQALDQTYLEHAAEKAKPATDIKTKD